MTTTQQDISIPTNIPVHTEFGTAYLTVVDANTITVTAGLGTPGPGLKMHGKEYSATIILRRTPDNKWDLAPAPQGVSRMSNAFIRRMDGTVQDAPVTYRAKLLGAVILAVNNWVQANWKIVDMAQYMATHRELVAVEADADTLRRQLQEKVEAATALRARLAACSYQPSAEQRHPETTPSHVAPAA